MGDVTLGSIALYIHSQVEGISAGVSGNLLDTIYDAVIEVQNFTGQVVGSPTVAEKFVPALKSLSMAGTLNALQLEGADATTIKLGDFSTSKGTESNLSAASDAYRKDGKEKLKVLGRAMNWNKTY